MTLFAVVAVPRGQVNFIRFGSETGALLLTHLPHPRHHGRMTGSENFILVMTRPDRRSACFASLASAPQRVVRSYGAADDAIAALDSCDGGCILIDSHGFVAGELARLLHSVGSRRDMVPLLLADRLDAEEAMALITGAPCDILPTDTPMDKAAERAVALLPEARRRAHWVRQCRSAEAMLARLSPREIDVLHGLAAGQTSKDMARCLGVSPRTIEVHRASIMRRTGAETLAELLRLCFLADSDLGEIYSKAA